MLEIDKEVTLTVLAQDIIDGIPSEPGCCAVAIALRRLFDCEVHVNTQNTEVVWVYAPSKHLPMFLHNRELNKFIVDFDDGSINYQNAKNYEFKITPRPLRASYDD